MQKYICIFRESDDNKGCGEGNSLTVKEVNKMTKLEKILAILPTEIAVRRSVLRALINLAKGSTITIKSGGFTYKASELAMDIANTAGMKFVVSHYTDYDNFPKVDFRLCNRDVKLSVKLYEVLVSEKGE